jgi:hypothetical protein
MMIRSASRARAGITLTEILISILIMGIGMISLATLFPLGLMRIREASRNARSALFVESCLSDAAARNLLAENSFSASWYGWGLSFPFDSPYTYDPSVANAPGTGIVSVTPPVSAGVNRTFGNSLPICYDPLWRTMVKARPNMPGLAGVPEARFASGLGLLRADPDGNAASAYGLQRLTNMPVNLPGGGTQWGANAGGAILFPAATDAYFLRYVGDIGASNDDPVMQEAGEEILATGQLPTKGSQLVPDLSISSGAITRDWSYTWFFTGYQSDVTNGLMLSGDFVVCHNRPFGLDANGLATDETVVEAVFAYSNLPNAGYSPNDQVVLLRWNPAVQADPDVRIGGWIADVTYERFTANDVTRWAGGTYPGQRCYWYRVVKRTAAEDEGANTPAPAAAGYRRMIVYVNSPVRARTPLAAGGAPLHLNAALVMPSVVNVFPKTVITH